MNKRKGFTLIEVLAVIVILAIIMVIAVPKVFDYIESSRKRSFYVSVSNLVDNIKPENVLEDKDYCMYNYSKDDKNKTDLIRSMYVLTKLQNGKIVYSVYAKSKNNDIINVSNFAKTDISNESTWNADSPEGEGSYAYEIIELRDKILKADKTANLYVPCGK